MHLKLDLDMMPVRAIQCLSVLKDSNLKKFESHNESNHPEFPTEGAKEISTPACFHIQCWILVLKVSIFVS